MKIDEFEENRIHHTLMLSVRISGLAFLTPETCSQPIRRQIIVYSKKTERSDSIVRSAAGGSIGNRHFFGFRHFNFCQQHA